jgi:hypothetical protein
MTAIRNLPSELMLSYELLVADAVIYSFVANALACSLLFQPLLFRQLLFYRRRSANPFTLSPIPCL